MTPQALAHEFSPCQALVFHDATTRARADSLLRQHLEAAATAVTNAFPQANLYVSGSIARGEPSLLYSGDQLVGLQSDVDFVVVGNINRRNLATVERNLNRLFPGWKDTLYAFAPHEIAMLRSASARDLSLGMAAPLRESFPLARPPAFILERGHALEVLAYQIVPVLSQSSAERSGRRPDVGGMWNRDIPYALHKLAVEALRAATVALPGQTPLPLTFARAHADRSALAAATGSTESRIVELLRVRERWTGQGIGWSEELASVVSGALKMLVGRDGDAAQTISQIRHELCNEQHPLHAYALAAIVAFARHFEPFDSPELRDLERDLLERLRGATHWRPPRAASLAATVISLRWEYLRELTRLKDAGIPVWGRDAEYVA